MQNQNVHFQKNQRFNEIKSHHYIISFDPRDVEDHGLTGKMAQQLCLDFAKTHFPGHQALVVTHTDGHNASGNIHTHIVINSVRKLDVENDSFAERECDRKAGYKHHLTKDYLHHLEKSVMEMCEQKGFHQVDLLNPAPVKITQSEYWAKRRGQKNLSALQIELRDINEQIRYTGQYYANRKVYQEMIHAPNKALFRKEHESEIAVFEEARKYLIALHPDKNFTPPKDLKKRKANLQELIEQQKILIQEIGNQEKELQIASENVDAILDQQPMQEQKKTHEEELS